MTLFTRIHTGIYPNDGTGDTLRNAFDKANTNFAQTRNDLTTAQRAVIFGDSIIRMTTDNGSNRNTYHGSRGFFTWLQVLMGFPFLYEVGNDGAAAQTGDNAGKGSENTADMLARIETDVLARDPDIVFFLGGVNDIDDGVDYATIISNIEAIATAILEKGIILVTLPIFPRRSPKDWNSAADRRKHHRVNHWLKVKALKTHGMLYLDIYKTLVDLATANGDLKADFTTDGLHPSSRNGYYIAKEAAKKLQSLLMPIPFQFFSPSDTYHATENPFGNLLPNGLLNGTAGQVDVPATGVAADSWRLYRVSGTTANVAGSKINHPDGYGGTMQRMVFSATGSGSEAQFYFTTNTASMTTGIITNGWYQGHCEIRVNGSANGLAILKSIYLEMWDTSTNGSIVRCLNNVPGDIFPNENWSGILKTPPLKLVGTTGLRFRLVVFINETVNDNITIEIGRCIMQQMMDAPLLP